jgi:hypothetical protein
MEEQRCSRRMRERNRQAEKACAIRLPPSFLFISCEPAAFLDVYLHLDQVTTPLD